ncbi:MAG: nucleotidyltransferase domain-containing protein [Opitutaceae bacterium]|nr:nucleotidyltransferase domain-containing protein [Opitutaceae bacterium]
MATLLQEITAATAARNEAERKRLLLRLREELGSLLPVGATVFVFGSLIQAGRFGEHSDLDLALTCRPAAFSEFWLQGELELRLGRRVDVLLLGETRLREKVEREGLQWTL